MIDQEIINSQKGIVKEIMSEILRNWSFKDGFVAFSLPAKIFSLKTSIQIIPEVFGNFQFIYKAKNAAKDASLNVQQQRIERLKYIMMLGSSGIFQAIQAKKPFNPYIGETFQCYFADGTEMFIEHINHNPPIDSFYIVNTKLDIKIYGSMKLIGKILVCYK